MQWDRPRVQDIFMQPTQQDVLNIRLGDLQTQDRIYWKENKANCFTVRSAYLVALRLNQGGVVENSRAHEDKRMWDKIWRLRIPPKVRNFGELAQTFFLLELILRDEDSLLILAMQSMVRQKNQFVMHYGSVR